MSLSFSCHFQYANGFELATKFRTTNGVTALCGPSGSGKTTVINLFAGLLKPQPGTIIVNNRKLVDTTSGTWLRPEERNLGIVFQDNLLFPHLTVKENLSYGKKRSPSRKVSLDQVTQILEIDDLLERRVITLSGGQSRRVALGRALLRSPDLLLLDEPLTGLEDDLKERVIDYLTRILGEWNIPILLVSHDQQSVEKLASQVISLDRGQVVVKTP